MDLLLHVADEYFFDPYFYPPIAQSLASSTLNQTAELWINPTLIMTRTWMPREALSLFLLLWIGGLFIYFIFASISYWLFFVVFKDVYYPSGSALPKPGQVGREIRLAMKAAPVMSMLTVPIILLEFRGYTKLYSNLDDYPISYFFASIALFLIFTDTCIYWIHRLEHDIPIVYKYIHKPHHEWYVPTPFAAIAFHPVDGWLQSLPYHFFPFFFPLHKILYLVLFVSVQLWTVSIHDGVDFHPGTWLNGSLHHTYHHSKFKYNYGQFFTFWDWFAGTYMDPYKMKQLEQQEKLSKTK